MSKTDRNLPHEVAYHRVTGKNYQENIVYEKDITDILYDIRGGDHYYYARKHDVNMRLGGYGYNNSRKYITSKSIYHVDTIRLYPEKRYYFNDGVLRKYKEEECSDSIDSLMGLTVGTNETLIDILNTFRPNSYFYDSDKISFNDIKDFSYYPVQYQDGSIMFLKSVNRYEFSFHSMSGYKYIYFNEPVVDVELYLVTSPVVTVREQFHEYDNLSGSEKIRISKMSDGFYLYDGVYYDHDSRRARDRDTLKEAVKMVNSGHDPYSIDIDLGVEKPFISW